MPQGEARTELRGAIARGDGADVVHLLTGRPWPDDALHLIGHGLLVALRQQVDGAGELAVPCAEVLRTREWDGDRELADSLQARLGTAPTRLLKPLLVDVEELSHAIGGRGAFRRFKDTLATWPELRTRWFAFSEDRQRGRARAWLSDEGYAATPPVPRQ